MMSLHVLKKIYFKQIYKLAFGIDKNFESLIGFEIKKCFNLLVIQIALFKYQITIAWIL